MPIRYVISGPHAKRELLKRHPASNFAGPVNPFFWHFLFIISVIIDLQDSEGKILYASQDGIKSELNNNTLIVGANAFYDHQLTESHERVGVGVEAITSSFDVRYNHYSAMSGRRTNAEGTIERALDGWDIRGDYHLPIDHDVNIFVSAFEFENPEDISSYKETGNKIGLDAKVGNFAIEAGYMDDNQENDAYFGNIKYVVNFGSDNQDHSSSNSKSLTDVSDKLYQPVKRENKIRVVKIDASGVVVGGF